MLNKQSLRDKQLLAWDRERRQLRQPPVRLLDVPIQQGWLRHFVLSPEAETRSDAATLAAILHVINTTEYHWRKDFQPTRRQLRLSRRTLSSDLLLRAVGIDTWEYHYYPEAWQHYFRRELVPLSLTLLEKGRRRYYRWVRPGLYQRRRGHVLAFAFRFPRLFVVKVERHWLTHVREIEPEVETRRAELDEYIRRNGGDHRLNHLYGYRHWRDYKTPPHVRAARKAAQREMRAALDNFHDRNQPGVADAMPLPCLGGLAAWRRPGSRARRNRLLGGKQHPGGGTLLLPG